MTAPESAANRPKPGRPPVCKPEVVIDVIDMRRKGLSHMQIAIALNARPVPTPMKKSPWSKEGVARLLRTQHAQAIARSMG